MPRILVTNDDGYHAEGIQVLARRLRQLGEVVIVAPDQEYSGAGAAIGALHLLELSARPVAIEGVDSSWAINAAPAMCVILASFGLFGEFDLVVSGINPGANTGRAIYHSGTVGAALTARNCGFPGIAVSQRAAGFAAVGQAEDPDSDLQQWDAAAEIAASVAAAVLAADEDDDDPPVVNVNVPNRSLDRITGFRHAEATPVPMRFLGAAALGDEPLADGAYPVSITWTDTELVNGESDEAALLRGEVSITYLSRLHAIDRPLLTAEIGDVLKQLL